MIIITKNTQVPGKIPKATDLVVGELAVNTNDGTLFTKHTDGQVKPIGGGSSGGITIPDIDILRMHIGII